jgi:hypothetical protein
VCKEENIMKLQLTVCELGKVLKKLEENYELPVLIKSNLSGGWMTITGKANILKIPGDTKAGCGGKDNIIHIEIKDENALEGTIIKITGAQDKKFNIDILSSRYREISPNNLTINQIKINENESKLKIDENIIFTINASVHEIEKLIES